MHLSLRPSIELLEARIAPAGVATSTFVDRDGDNVMIKITSATASSAMLQAALTTAVNGGGTFLLEGAGLQLRSLNLTAPIFAGVDVSIMAKRDATAGGDGLVSVGDVDGGSNPLGLVVIDGDLGRIVAGDGSVGLKSLTVQSIGQNSAETGDFIFSQISGSMGKILVKDDVVGANLVLGGKVGSLTIGGSLVGNDDSESGSISIGGLVGSVKIGRDIIAGDGNVSGRIEFNTNVKSFTVGGTIYGPTDATEDASAQINFAGKVDKFLVKGDIVGGHGNFANNVFQVSIPGSVKTFDLRGSLLGSADASSGNRAGSIRIGGVAGSINIGGDILGSTSVNTGALFYATATSVTVGGDLRGGPGTQSGTINPEAGLTGSLTIRGDIVGGDGSLLSGGITGTLATTFAKLTIGGNLESRGDSLNQGFIRANIISNLRIGGDIIASTEPGSTTEQIQAFGSLGKVSIGGSIRGNAENTVRIVADSVASFAVGRNAEYAEVGLLDIDGQVKLISVKGAWIASRFSFSANDGADNIYGTTDDPALSPNGTSRIANIIIGGQVTGTSGGADSFVIRANSIGALSVAKTKYPFGAGPQDFTLGITSDVVIRDLV